MIPNVTGYDGFKSYGQAPYSFLKPGQMKLDRQYYEKATNERADGKSYLANSSRFSSLYNEDANKTVKVGDFKVPNRDCNPLADYELRHNP